MDFQNRAWGYKFGDREIQGSKIVIVLGALFLILSPIHRDQSDINNYLLAGVGLLAAAGAWMLSIYKPIAEAQKRIQVIQTTKPRVGNSPIYLVLIVFTLLAFGVIILGHIYSGWNQ